MRLLRENADLRWLFFAQVVSFLGDWFTFVAIAALVLDATGSEFLVAVAYVSFSLPSFLASPIAGSLADRFDRRRLLLVVSALQAVAALGLLTASNDREWPLFLFQGLISSLAAVVKPAIDAGVPNLATSPDELRRANAMFGSMWGVMLAVGAGIGGIFSEAFGRQAAFIADAITFVVALALFALVRRPMQEPQHRSDRPPVRPIADMREAIRYARRDRVVMSLVGSKATFAIGAGTVSQLPVLARDAFGWGDVGTGLLMGARGVGVGLGPLIAAQFTKGQLSRVLRVCGIAGVAYSAFYLGAAWVPLLPVAAIFIALGHLGGGSQWTLSSFGLQVRTPDAIRGRVMAGDFAIVTLVISITSLLAGWLSEAVGAQWTITVSACAAGLAGAIYLVVTTPVARQLEAEHAAASAIAASTAPSRESPDA